MSFLSCIFFGIYPKKGMTKMTSAVLKTLLIASLSNHNDNDGNKKIKKQHL